MRTPQALLSLVTVFSLALATHATESLATVPFIGCPADGQQGPVKAPKGEPKHLPISQSAAEHLAWYQTSEEADSLGTLAPRGWHCFGAYGSSGSAIYVAPEPLDTNKVILRQGWKGFTGPAVELSLSYGDTSGRFEVAKVIARVFPAHRNFVRDVIAEGLEPSSDFPTGVFPADHLTYKGNELVEFTTPAGHKGLGTMSWLLPSDQPISGMTLLSGEETNLVQLNMRLPPNLIAFGPVIIQQAERELRTPKPPNAGNASSH